MPHDAGADRVLVIGEALVDVVAGAGSDEVAHPGGSPLNVAVGVSRLGLATTLHSQFGADPHGVTIAQHLADSGVAVTPATVTTGRTSVARASIGPDGAAAYAFAIEWDPAPLEVLPGAFDAVHAGSIGAWLEPGADAVERLVAALRPEATITFDPNVRPQLMGERREARERVERLVALADVVKASEEDIAWLYPDSTIPEILHRWAGLGPGLALVTRGADGVDAFAESGIQHVPAARAAVHDTIGAGDSFMAGLVAALSDLGLLGAARREDLRAIGRADVRRVAQFGIRCAAITVSRPGADPPTRAEVGW